MLPSESLSSIVGCDPNLHLTGGLRVWRAGHLGLRLKMARRILVHLSSTASWRTSTNFEWLISAFCIQ